MKRFPSALPPTHSQIGWRADLKENQLAGRLHDTVHATKSFDYAGNGAQREGADDGIDARVSERNAFARESEELDSQGCSAEASFSQLHHSWIWLECVDPPGISGLQYVLAEARAWPRESS
jgi:hypothetical protein